MAADLKGVVAGRDLVGPDGTDPDDGAEDPRIRARQDPVLDGDLLEQLELVECVVGIKILRNMAQSSQSRIEQNAALFPCLQLTMTAAWIVEEIGVFVSGVVDMDLKVFRLVGSGRKIHRIRLRGQI
jgi:hypothetical protein